MDILSLIIKELKYYSNKDIETYFIPVTSEHKYYSIVDKDYTNANITNCIESKYVIKLINNVAKFLKKYTSNVNINFCECRENELLSMTFHVNDHDIDVKLKVIYGNINVLFQSNISLISIDSLMTILDESKLEYVIKNLMERDN